MPPGYNQRNYTRILADMPVTFVAHGSVETDGVLADISAGGLRIESTHPLPVGTPVTCSFYGSNHTLIDVRGEVCAVDGVGFGVRLTGYDVVSYSHLKSLLISLADDPHAVENEILLNLDVLPEPD